VAYRVASSVDSAAPPGTQTFVAQAEFLTQTGRLPPPAGGFAHPAVRPHRRACLRCRSLLSPRRRDRASCFSVGSLQDLERKPRAR